MNREFYDIESTSFLFAKKWNQSLKRNGYKIFLLTSMLKFCKLLHINYFGIQSLLRTTNVNLRGKKRLKLTNESLSMIQSYIWYSPNTRLSRWGQNRGFNSWLIGLFQQHWGNLILEDHSCFFFSIQYSFLQKPYTWVTSTKGKWNQNLWLKKKRTSITNEKSL